ncbi:probable nucleoredoxin 1 [Zingiber officinale]|uniref:protein-disulfide reductase n=1 Tax=Zingiber officinale TaxID=94328 RepID=A0A8J5L7F4_ZINOF|nr:probable nucleoredoxin 1 [Zingiber officinale]KAG6516000.1 hypothetical protein ZIOFF_026447 [Zingiber officinale]
MEQLEGATFDLRSLLGSEDRDFLIRSNGDQVKISSLQGKVVGLLFSSSGAPMLCEWFIPLLAQVYKELSVWNADFEIVVVPCEMGEEYFTAYFSDTPMPWLAVPFSGADLGEPFGGLSLPSLVVLDANGKVATTKGVDLANRYRGAAYPFTEERVRELEAEEEAMLQNPTLENMLISGPIDFVLSGDGNKTVAIYFTMLASVSNDPVAQQLLDMHMKLKEIGEEFEVVVVSTDTDTEWQPFDQGLAGTAWLAVPYQSSTSAKLVINFCDDTLVIIGPDGKLLCRGVSDVVEYHGIDAYPFSPEKLEELAQLDKAKIESQTLESLLVSGELDYVLGKDGLKVPVTELVGMNVLFYFSKKDGAFAELLPVLIKAYRNIKERGNSFEIIFVSEDTDEESFEDRYGQMPWLALPFGDARKKTLTMAFNKPSDSDLVVVGPNGETVATRASGLVCSYGAAAFPFTKQREEVELEEVANGWPERINFYHYGDYELVKIYDDNFYFCDKCLLDGAGWQYWNEDHFRVHPRCALPENEEMNGTYEEDAGGEGEEQVE